MLCANNEGRPLNAHDLDSLNYKISEDTRRRLSTTCLIDRLIDFRRTAATSVTTLNRSSRNLDIINNCNFYFNKFYLSNSFFLNPPLQPFVIGAVGRIFAVGFAFKTKISVRIEPPEWLLSRVQNIQNLRRAAARIQTSIQQRPRK